MDTSDDQEEHPPNPYRGCQIGACFACGLGVRTRLPSDNGQRGGSTNISEWRRDRPNPLPTFPMPDEFYTPILLPGMYLPLEFVSTRIGEKSPFRTVDDPELARYVAAFLDHENAHRHLLVGVVPMLMRLISSRCYAQIALLTKRFRPSRWEVILSQSNNIENLYRAIAPLHEVVANLRNLGARTDNPYALNIGEHSLAKYKKVYGKGFENVLNDFSYIVESLEEWFAPSPIQPSTIYALAEFMLVGALDSREMRSDLFTSPPLIPKGRLTRHLVQAGYSYFDLSKQPPKPLKWNLFTYTVHDITGRLKEIKLGIQKAKLTRSKKPLETDIEQLMYIAKAIPRFHAWLQRMDILHWLKRRILDGISEVQDMIKGNGGFDLPLVEAWQLDNSPYISIIIPNKSTNEVECFNYGVQQEPFAEKMGAQFSEQHRQELRELKEHMMSLGALVIYCLQSDRKVGVWYAPSSEKVAGPPITPAVLMFSQGNDGDEDLVGHMADLTIFESLRVQIASGEGISCLLRHQHRRCCGRAALIWSIYEAGIKATDELGWQPSLWLEPECSKPDNR